MTNYFKVWTELLEHLSQMQFDEEGNLLVTGLGGGGGLTFVDIWDASTGEFPPATEKGQFWIISVAGVIDETDYNPMDWIVYADDDPVRWVKVDNSDLGTDHALLNNLAWSLSGHIIDSTLDMLDNPITNAQFLELEPQDTPPLWQPGRFYYDNVLNTFSCYVDKSGVILDIGEEQWVRGKNNDIVPMTKGQIVYIQSAEDVPPHPLFKLATAIEGIAGKTMAMLIESSLAINAPGIFITYGIARNLDTITMQGLESWTQGDELWLSPTVPGGITNIKPTGDPARRVRVGWLLRHHASLGSIYVSISAKPMAEAVFIKDTPDRFASENVEDALQELMDYNSRATAQFWVSGDYGSDDYGDGGITKPFQTIQKALDVGFVSEEYIEVFLDASVPASSCVIPGSKKLALFGTGAMFGSGSPSITVTLNLSSTLYGNNVSLQIIANDICDVRLEECALVGITNPLNVSLLMAYTQLGLGGIPASSNSGFARQVDSSFVFFDKAVHKEDIDMDSNKIENLADAVFDSDAMNLGQLKSRINEPIALAGETPVNSDISGWIGGSCGFGVGTTDRIFMMYNFGDEFTPIVKFVEVS